MKKYILIIILCIAAFTGCGSGEMSDTEKKEAAFAYYEETGDYDATVRYIKELYPDDEEKRQELILTLYGSQRETTYIESGKGTVVDDSFSEYKPEVTGTDSLKIQDGWKWTKDGDYSYVTGRVKNIGSDPISYFEVTAEYLDTAGQVLDSDYTNSGQQLNPEDMKEFEIMHENDPEYTKVQIYVNEASY